MFVVFVVGMAGSGKSLLTSAFSEWLKLTDQNVLTLNLDPGSRALPYNPDVDVRRYVNIDRLMDEYQLGPNGALIMASDLAADHVEEIRGEIEDANPDIVLADTPGQIELFAFREGGPYISKAISEETKAVVYLLDAPFCRNPMNFVSNMFLAAAVYSRLGQPQVYALSKADLISEGELDNIAAWSSEIEALESALQAQTASATSLITRDLANAVFGTGLVYEPVPVSAKLNQGFIELNAALTRIMSGGEEPRP